MQDKPVRLLKPFALSVRTIFYTFDRNIRKLAFLLLFHTESRVIGRGKPTGRAHKRALPIEPTIRRQYRTG